MSKGVRKAKPLFEQQSLFPEQIPLPCVIYNNDVQIDNRKYIKDGNVWKQHVNNNYYDVVTASVIQQLEEKWREQNMLPGAKLFIANQ